MSNLRADGKSPPANIPHGPNAHDEARAAQERRTPRPPQEDPADVLELYNLPFTD
jgi:hypothetical protein